MLNATRNAFLGACVYWLSAGNALAEELFSFWQVNAEPEHQLTYAQLSAPDQEISLMLRCIQGKLDSLMFLPDHPQEHSFHYMTWQFDSKIATKLVEARSVSVVFHHFDDSVFILDSASAEFYVSWFELYYELIEHQQLTWLREDKLDLIFSYNTAFEPISQVLQVCENEYQLAYQDLFEELNAEYKALKQTNKSDNIEFYKVSIKQLNRYAKLLATKADIAIRLQDFKP
ncbi:hypothetical protein AHAT_24940 [Agarivorans sp. Toyoura001]|uniref:hypothetical protein n=1 Tax=Agarivorans sp. Toyoura001 TaxID=2283141 RepID=UPI0010E2EE7A|nr:hypothetical protein [Agarivorans sp. Toyoura001]GDY26604.1 hypothetical protein AHAT_24940 [Agarivorans sp. Toyoura001]